MDVTVHEARSRLGGRAGTTPAPYRANWGPHAMYSDGPMWAWLERHELAQPAHDYPLTARVTVRVDGRVQRLPPARVLSGLLRLRRLEAPVDLSFAEWAEEQLGDAEVARRIANFMGVATFDHDPGRLSAAFVNPTMRRVTAFPPVVRYPTGGWAMLVDRLDARARQLGVRIATRSPVDSLPPAPVVLAVPLDRAAALLGDPALCWTGTRTALLDVGMRRRRRDPYVVSDLDASGWAETFSVPDPSVVPDGEQLVQAQAGLRPGESLEEGVTRVEEMLDAGYPDWRSRETWRRRMVVEDESGALDLPGTTWRDRPAGDRGDGVHLVGDMVAAPGLLSEVSFVSALNAVAHVAGQRQLSAVA